MTERKRIRLVGESEAELVGDASARSDDEAALDAALEDLARRAAARPAPPARIRALMVERQAAVAWTPVIDAIAYHVLKPASDAVARFPDDAKRRITDSSFLDGPLDAGGTYHYAVAAENGAERVGDPSDIVSVSVPGDRPPASELSSSDASWRPGPIDPAITFDWKPVIGAPAWGNLDVAEIALRSRFDVQAAGLRPFVIASLEKSMPYETGLTRAMDHLRSHGTGRPYVGLSLGSAYALSQPAFVSELGGLAYDLGHYGVGLALRVDR